MSESDKGKAKFDFIRYASVWEDADILCEALEPVAKGGRLLSIASSGDNALSLLTLDPEEVVAVDLNPAQIACSELRREAFRFLNYQTLLGFLGVNSLSNREEIYQELRNSLTQKSRVFWDDRRDLIKRGIIHTGKFEKYLRFFGQKILPWIHGKRKRKFLMEPHGAEEREEFYKKYWDTWRWKVFFKVFFSRSVMGRGGRDPSFFDHVEGSVAEKILARTEHALTKIPTDTNPYLTYIMTGNYSQKALPLYLREKNFSTIKAKVGRLKFLEGRVQEPAGKFHGFNLSDIFEYMSESEFRSCYSSVLEKALPKARLVYWNMLVPRGIPESFHQKARPHELAKLLYRQDKAWFYQAFHVDEVRIGS